MIDVIMAVAKETETPEADWVLSDGPNTGVGVEYYAYNDKSQIMAYVCVDQGVVTVLELQNYYDREPEIEDGDHMTDIEADADTLRNAGMGTDEDYGVFHDHLERDHDELYIPEQDD